MLIVNAYEKDMMMRRKRTLRRLNFFYADPLVDADEDKKDLHMDKKHKL